MVESGTTSRKRLQIPGNSIWGIIDVKKMKPCREPVEMNSATSFATECVLQALSTTPLELRPTGFIGITGESKFLRTQFPENLLSIIASHIELMVQTLLIQRSDSAVRQSGEDYVILLAYRPDREGVREWLGREVSGPSRDIKTVALDGGLGQNEGPNQDHKCNSEMPTVHERMKLLLEEISKGHGKDFVTQSKEFSDLEHDFRKTIAALLQEPLNVHLQTLPQETPHEKQALAVWVNAQLRELGLAIRCPKTNRPSTLISDIKESGSAIGRFRFENRDEHGAKVRSLTSTHLPDLELMEDIPRKEPLLDWSQRTRKRESPKRG